MPRKAKAVSKGPSRLRKVVLGFAIGVIFTLFIFYGIWTFYPEPKYEDFCDTKYAQPYPIGKDIPSCEVLLNMSAPQCPDGYYNRVYNATLGCEMPVCETCQVNYEEKKQAYDSNVFFIAIITGAIALSIGAALGVEAVGSGLMFGGVLTIFFGVVRNWSHLGNIAKFCILGVVLGGLIWIGYRKMKD